MAVPTHDTERWNDVLDAAIAVFSDRGYERATVADIAAAAGLAKPSLYHYMRSKEDLLEAIVRRSHDRLTAQLAGLPRRDSALEMIWQIVYTHVLFNVDYAAETQIWLADYRMLRPERRQQILDTLNEYDRTLQALIEEAQRRGEAAADLDARLAVLSILGGANYVARWYKPRPESQPERIARTFADLGIAALRSADVRLGPVLEPLLAARG